MAYVNQFIAKGTSDERFIRLKTGWPGRVEASDFLLSAIAIPWRKVKSNKIILY